MEHPPKRTLPGDADSPGRDIPVHRPSHLPETLGGHVSQQSLGGVQFTFVYNQSLGPVRLAQVRTAGHNSSGSSIHDNQGSATVARLDNRAAAATGSIPGSSSGKPDQPAFASAPSGYGSRFGTTSSGRAGCLPVWARHLMFSVRQETVGTAGATLLTTLPAGPCVVTISSLNPATLYVGPGTAVSGTTGFPVPATTPAS
jgi:hypothetical protein